MARMTRIALSTFESLRKTDGGLFHALLKATHAEAAGGKTVMVDSADIKGESFQLRWKQWVERNPGLVLSEDSEQNELWQAEQAAAKLEADKAHVKKHADECAARYFQHWVPKGLIDNQQNRSEVFAELEKREKQSGTIPSAPLLDIVIPFLSRQGLLQWKQPPIEVPTTPAEPPPPPVLLADGSEQLPLGTTPRSRHSVLQLRDLDKRTREANNAAMRAANNAVAAAFAEANKSAELV